MLDQIFKKRGCDKHDHGYASLYEQLESIKHPKSILEIGVFMGDSMMSWSDRFPNSELVGLEINTKNIKAIPKNNFSLFDGDFREYKTKKTFDWIIDDGSHTEDDVKEAFNKFWPLVNSGGFYIIEDLHCAYWYGWHKFITETINALTHNNGFEENKTQTGFVIQQKSIIAIQKP